jgi:hypothetical protein
MFAAELAAMLDAPERLVSDVTAPIYLAERLLRRSKEVWSTTDSGLEHSRFHDLGRCA